MNWNRPLARRSLFKAAAAGLTTYLLGGCAAPSPASGPQLQPTIGIGERATATPAPGSTIRLLASMGQGLFEAPQPLTVRTGPGILLMSFLFDSLLWRDSTPEPIPWLAEKWTASPDGTEWTFVLRSGVRFHDGQPLTAEDAAFSYQYLGAQTGTYIGGLADPVKAAQAVDERTLRITLKEPFAPFLNNVAAWIPVIPKHLWADVAEPLKLAEPKAFIGSGPYRLAAMNETNSSFLFVANENFFLGKPFVPRLEFVPAGDELVALKAGQLDVASPNIAQGMSGEVLAPFKSDPNFAILQAPGEGTTALHFNISRGSPYNDVQFRRAIIHAIDRQELIDRVLGSSGEPGSPGFLPSANPYATKDVEQYPYDLQKARALLDKAGFGERDGQRHNPDGSPLVLPLLFGAPLARVAEFVRSQLSQLGVRVDLRSADAGTASQLQGAGNYDVALVTYGGLGSDPDFLARTFCSPEQSKFWWKPWGYRNPGLDQLAKEQRSAFDKEQRRAIVHKMQRVISEDVPIMPLYYPDRFLIYAPAVFDAWYYTPLWTPLPNNKHAFVTGQKTGLAIRQR